MENQVYNWFVKQGTITIQRNGEFVNIKMDYENNESCLLTKEDTNDIIALLTDISKEIWQSPGYTKKPYSRLYKSDQGSFYWEIEHAVLTINHNHQENAIQMRYSGSNEMSLELNCVVEVIQILEHLNK